MESNMAMGYSLGSIQHEIDLYTKCTNRGKVMKLTPSPHDPRLSGLQVMCKEHPRIWIAVDVIGMDTAKSISDLIDEAFDRCQGCIDGTSWAKTRFPEDAEL